MHLKFSNHKCGTSLIPWLVFYCRTSGRLILKQINGNKFLLRDAQVHVQDTEWLISSYQNYLLPVMVPFASIVFAL